MSKRIVLPGATIGVLGSGQLGRMFTIAARRLGYRVHVLSPDADTPTGQVADLEINASYDDREAVARFARQVQVVTFEFENVPKDTAELVAQHAPVRPAGSVLHVTQNRFREKSFLRDAGFPVTPFCSVRGPADIPLALDQIGVPAVLKTAEWGYDGKGQAKLATREQAADAWSALGEQETILEQYIEFDSELSVVAARGLDGQIEHFAPFTNMHRNHILDVSISPATVSDQVAQAAVEIARGVLAKLEVVGVLCVEFFVTRDGQLMINELAPRPHNSGHLTIDAHVSCQFEQQVRAVCGLPLGSTEQLRPAAMANLMGDMWGGGEPNWSAACAFPEVKLHLYGKAAARPGRKMGHLTALATDPQIAAARVRDARQALSPSLHKAVTTR
ncbi:MAG: 5-(carboxyamino)imidazole ribonucleotide synthase [Planctomycetota bacterium]